MVPAGAGQSHVARLIRVFWARTPGPSRSAWDARNALVRGGLPIPSSLLITGATGMIGSLLADALVAQGVEFTVMLRPGGSGDRIAGKPGVSSTEGDFDDPASLRRALEGVDRAFLLTNSSERTEAQQIAFVEAARAQRVGHVVYLSQLASDPQSEVVPVFVEL